MEDLEKNGWESFEMGFYDEVIHLSKENPNNKFLEHLALISRIEEGETPECTELSPGESQLSLIAESFLQYSLGIANRDTLKKYLLFLQSTKLPLCLVFFQFGVRLSYELQEYGACLFIMSKDRSGLNEEFYSRERIQCYFYLGKHIELIAYFKKFNQSIPPEISTYMKVGLSLQAIGKFQESEKILSQIPGRKKLPTFEEKKKELKQIIDNIPELEKKENPSKEELKNLGFAYLFNQEYKKAEEIFKKATILIAEE